MNNSNTISILNGRLIDPAHGIDATQDLHIGNGKVLSLGAPPEGFSADTSIDASDKIVCPGLIDLCANLRQPGAEHKATIASETAAAAAGGITTLCCPPDTLPVIDTQAVAEQIQRLARAAGHCRLLPQGAQTKGLEGSQLSEMAALKRAGCCAVSNAYTPLLNTLVQRRALEYAATFNILTIIRPQDEHLANQGCVHEGKVADRLGLPGIPEAAETVAIARDLALAEHAKARIHFHAISSARGSNMLARACFGKQQVSADVAIHQLFLTEMDVESFDSNAHVIPPLRTSGDRDGLRQALADNLLSAICSDHQPHEPDAKAAPFPATEPGISGLDTLLSLTLKLVEERVLDLPDAIARLTSGPAKILDLPFGQLAVGASADICIFDPQQRWTVRSDQLLSQGKNSPFIGWDLPGRVSHTLLEGRIVYTAEPA